MVLADVEARTMTDDFTVPPAMDAAIRSYDVKTADLNLHEVQQALHSAVSHAGV